MTPKKLDTKNSIGLQPFIKPSPTPKKVGGAFLVDKFRTVEKLKNFAAKAKPEELTELLDSVGAKDKKELYDIYRKSL